MGRRCWIELAEDHGQLRLQEIRACFGIWMSTVFYNDGLLAGLRQFSSALSIELEMMVTGESNTWCCHV